MKSFTSALVLGLVALLAPISTSALDFEKAAFEKAKTDGKAIVLNFHATWCATCKKQQPALQSILGEPEYLDFEHFNVDFDWSEELNESFGVKRQATLLVFKGEKEVSRTIGLTDKDDLRTELKKAK